MALITVATCALSQFALDFEHNLRNVITSIRVAKSKGAKLRIGPELELCGYGCEDHFYEEDTIRHCWECIEEILKSDVTNDILVDVGMPVAHFGVRYNCRVIMMNRRILMIRPKMWLAEDGNYREGRWFAAWGKGYVVEDHILPERIRELTQRPKCPFGVGALQFIDTMYASETCEELFTANNPAIALGLAGVEIIGNGSGSHHTLAKATRRFELIEEETKKNGGVYLYANQSGCDGGRLYFDGSAIIASNGRVVSHGTQFNIQDVEVVTATIDLRDVRNYRCGIMSRGRQAALAPRIPIIEVDEALTVDPARNPLAHDVTEPNQMLKHTVEEEVAYGPACWMWDYLRRSGLQGFFLPLSGGADSAAVAALVRVMARLIYEDIELKKGPQDMHSDVAVASRSLQDLQRIVRDPSFVPKSAKDICSRLFYTAYMGTKHSSDDTRRRAEHLAKEIGCNFSCFNIDSMVEAICATFGQVGPQPDINVRGTQQNIAAQNIQARSRMVLSYVCAQMFLVKQRPNDPWPGQLLVLGSATLDEGIRGYFTKYDCSSADINPIGSLPKLLLRKFLVWAAEMEDMPTLLEIAAAPASAELQPLENGTQTQTSEDEMGLSYEELDVFSRLRLNQRCGPVSMYQKVSRLWQDHMSPRRIADTVKRFFKYYAINRHKMSVLPPSVHLGSHSPDDNRYDLRQIVYNCAWPWQFARVDEMAEQDEVLYQTQIGRKRTSRGGDTLQQMSPRRTQDKRQ
jgi:NAD+ synthase (glutamine-hydrolysing)